MPNMRKTRCRNRGKTLLIMRTSTCQNTERDKVQETTIPSKQSTTGESQHLYPSIVNWVTSVTHSAFGASAWKSRPASGVSGTLAAVPPHA